MPRLHHSHYFGSGAVHSVQPDPLSNRILVRPVGLRKLLVHHCHAVRSSPVVVRESTSAHDLDIHSAEVSGVHGGADHDVFFLALRELIAVWLYTDHGLEG